MWKVKIEKFRSTWTWFTENPVGGGFGSNAVTSKRLILARAIQNIPQGEKYEVINAGKSEGVYVK